MKEDYREAFLMFLNSDCKRQNKRKSQWKQMEMYAKMVTDIVTKSVVSAQLQGQRNKNGGEFTLT